MSVRVNVRMSKIMRTPKKVGDVGQVSNPDSSRKVEICEIKLHLEKL